MTRALLSTLVLALAAAPLAAQDEPAGLAGRNAVSFNAGGGYLLGLWRQTSPGVRVGLEVGAELGSVSGDNDDQEFINLTVQPSVKLFSTTEGPLRPYTVVGLHAERSRQTASLGDGTTVNELDIATTRVGAQAGVGMEWMPVSRVAVGGHVGVRASRLWNTNETSQEHDDDRDGWNVGTFTTGLVLTLFF